MAQPTWGETGVQADDRHRELLHRLRDFNRMIRTLRHHRATQQPVVPLGTVGILTWIEELTDRPGRRTDLVGCHAKELAECAGLDPSTVSRIIATLVAQGLVVRRTDPADRRASFLALTEHGRVALAEAQGWYVNLVARALAGWSPAEIATLSASLGRFVSDIQRSLDGVAAEQNNPHDRLEDAR